jgi:hypothetical protein
MDASLSWPLLGAKVAAAVAIVVAASLTIATSAWLAAAFALTLRDWTFLETCLLFAGAFALAIKALARFALASPAPRAPRARYGLALRAALVAGVVVATTTASHVAGPAATGIVFPLPTLNWWILRCDLRIHQCDTCRGSWRRRSCGHRVRFRRSS